MQVTEYIKEKNGDLDADLKRVQVAKWVWKKTKRMDNEHLASFLTTQQIPLVNPNLLTKRLAGCVRYNYYNEPLLCFKMTLPGETEPIGVLNAPISTFVKDMNTCRVVGIRGATWVSFGRREITLVDDVRLFLRHVANRNDVLCLYGAFTRRIARSWKEVIRARYSQVRVIFTDTKVAQDGARLMRQEVDSW